MIRHIRFLAALFIISLLITTSTFWYFETSVRTDIDFIDTLWWWVVTSTTVGYGDIVPITPAGRIAGFVAIIVGIFGYTHTISIILQSVHNKLEKHERGKGIVKSFNHLLICEYTAFADELIQEIDEKNLFNDKEKVILTTLVDRRPYKNYIFIYGVPISPQHLERANASKASDIFVFSNTRFNDPDIKTLHVVSRILTMNDHARIYIELENENHELLYLLSRRVTIMKTRDLLNAALQQKHLQIQTYLHS